MLCTLARISFSITPFPDNLIYEMLNPKHRIHEAFQVVAGGGVAVQVDGTCRLQNPSQLHQPGSHHHQVGQHVVVTQELLETLKQVYQRGRSTGHKLVIGAGRDLVPVPEIGKGLDLRGRRRALRLLEQYVIRSLGVERRVEVD
ncbi:hypothetical protein ES703_123320 [subsurface metagenome]